MSDNAEPRVLGEEEKRLKRKQSLEASVNLGLGYGKKKKQHIEAFYSAIWPVLEGGGWNLAKGEGDEEGATYFLPPGVTISSKSEDHEDAPQEETSKESATPTTPTAEEVQGPWDCSACGHTNVHAKSRCTGVVGEGTKCMAWRGGRRLRRPYLSKVRDVIERVLERRNDVETEAANAYMELFPDGADIFAEQKEKKKDKEDAPSSPSRASRVQQQQNHASHFAWKDEQRTHYEKTASRVGSEFQVGFLPAAGSYTSAKDAEVAQDGGALYERVWDPEAAEKSGKLDFVHTRVKFNKKEAAYNIFHSRGYRLPGFYHEVSDVSPTDASDWTKEDKDRFRAAVFEHHEDMREVSKAIGKPINECITHYLVRFKRTKSYKSLKRSMKRKANVSEGSAGTLVCNECGKGGMLIACDTCEAHYHLSCATPPLASIPDGNWACGNCKRETRSMLSSQDENSCGTDQQANEGSVDASMEGAEGSVRMEKKNAGTEESDYSRDAEVETKDVASDGAGENGNKLELEAQGSTDSNSVLSETGKPRQKRMRLDEAKHEGSAASVPM